MDAKMGSAKYVTDYVIAHINQAMWNVFNENENNDFLLTLEVFDHPEVPITDLTKSIKQGKEEFLKQLTKELFKE